MAPNGILLSTASVICSFFFDSDSELPSSTAGGQLVRLFDFSQARGRMLKPDSLVGSYSLAVDDGVGNARAPRFIGGGC